VRQAAGPIFEDPILAGKSWPLFDSAGRPPPQTEYAEVLS
jgi:hypothetical protein